MGMRIGLIAPPMVPVPPPAYGGTEAVVDNLARGLHQLGHEVRLFTVAESACPVNRSHLFETGLMRDSEINSMGMAELEAAHALAAYDEFADMDIIHDHTRLGPLIGPRPYGPPVVTTSHLPFDETRKRTFGRIAGQASIVAISHAQRRFAGEMPVVSVIHHGIDLQTYRPGPGGGGFLLFVGRMAEEKGVHRAIRVAHRAGRKLIIIAKQPEASEIAYYERQVRPLLHPGDPEPREEPLDRRIELMGLADAVVNPISWPEPFGLVMAEALACGTPVLAFPNGAAPEIIDHGRTGFLCADEDAMVAALSQLSTIDRADCRAAAERKFDMHRMALDHEALYRKILSSNDWRPLVSVGA